MEIEETWDDDDQHDDWDDAHNEDDDDDYTVECSECGTDVYEDAEQCPACGNYITHSTSVWSGRPGWWIVLGVLGILAVIFTLAL